MNIDKYAQFNRTMQMLGEENTFIAKAYNVITLFLFENYQLEDLRVPDGVEAIERKCDMEAIRFTKEESIGKLKRIHIPDSVEWIGKEALSFMDLRQVTGGNGVRLIDKKSFYGCSKLQELKLENLTFMGEYAIRFCRQLTKLVIGPNCFSVWLPVDGCFGQETIEGRLINREVYLSNGVIKINGREVKVNVDNVTAETIREFELEYATAITGIQQMRACLDRLKLHGWV